MDNEGDCRECSHEDPNLLATCVRCNTFSFLVRAYRMLPQGSVVGYCPLCGITVSLA